MLWHPLMAVVLAFSSVWFVGAAKADFSAKERQALDSGKLVVRHETKALGNLKLIGGTSWLVVNSSPDQVWRGFQAFERYRYFLPQCRSSKIVSRSGDDVVLRIEHEEGPVFARYFMEVQVTSSVRAARFRLSSKHKNDIREGWGFVKISSFKGGRTLISFGVMADVGSGIVAGAVRNSIHDWMLRVPSLFESDLRRQKRVKASRK